MRRHKEKPSRPSRQRNALLNYVEGLQSQGRLVFTAEEAQKALGEAPNAFIKASLRLMRKDKLFRPASGFYVTIPTEYRSGKSVPAEWYIDALMNFHGLPYYVGGLSAAALHGAAHQAPQELQVVTTEPLRTIITNRTRIRFLTKKDLASTPTQEIKTPAGYFKASTPEATALDLVRYYRRVGFLSHVATVLAELSERIDPRKLAEVAKKEPEAAHVQRLGYLLEQFGKKDAAYELRKWISKRDLKLIPLRPGWDGEVTARDPLWRILVNDQVELIPRPRRTSSQATWSTCGISDVLIL